MKCPNCKKTMKKDTRCKCGHADGLSTCACYTCEAARPKACDRCHDPITATGEPEFRVEGRHLCSPCLQSLRAWFYRVLREEPKAS